MKRFFSTTICFLIVLVTHAQSLPRALARSWIMESQKVETLNQNNIANRRLSGENKRYSCRGCTNNCVWNSEVIHTGRKDFQGNEILHVKMYKDKDTKDQEYILLKPDFEYYPLKYEYFWVLKDEIRKSGSDEVGGKMVKGTYSLVLVDNEDGLFCSGESDIFSRGPVKLDRDKWFYKYIYATKNESSHFGVLSEEETNTRHSLVDARYRKEIGNLFDAVLDYNEKVMQSIEGKTYDEQMAEFSDGDAFMFKSSRFDSLKVKFIKGSDGIVSEIVLHYPFLGNVYHDNEKFIRRVKKDASGFFKVEGEHAYIKIQNGYIVPFEGRLLFCNFLVKNGHTYDAKITDDIGTVKINNVLSKDITDSFPYHVSGDRLYNGDRTAEFYRYYTYDGANNETFYNKWWMNKFLETSYDYSKDERRFSVFLLRYIKKIIENSKG